MRTAIIVAALFGCLAGLLEAARLAILGRRPDQLILTAGYGVLVNAAVFALAGGLLVGAWAVACRARGAPFTARPLLRLMVPAGFLAAAALPLLSGGGPPTRSASGGATQALAWFPVLLGATVLGLCFSWLIARQASAGRLVLRRVLERALAACLSLATLVVVLDLSAHGLAGSRLPAVPTPLPAASAVRAGGVDRPVEPASLPTETFAPEARPPRERSPAPTASLSAVASRPNVLLITVDTLRADRLGLYGNDSAPTPEMDRLGRQGVAFEMAIVPQPGTNATHATLLTGAYPSRHGVRAHMLDTLDPSVATLPEHLKRFGYATAGIYSWISLEPIYSGLDRGFDSYEDYAVNVPAYLAGGPLRALALGYKKATERLALPGLFDRQLGAARRVEDSLDGKADVTTDAALRWLERRGPEPFFLWVHYFDPHYPYSPPEPFASQFDRPCEGCADGSLRTIDLALQGRQFSPQEVQRLFGLYDGEVAFTDREIGRLLRALDEQGLAERTLVVLTGDHGESFGEHGLWVHGLSLYQHELRVPLLMRYPPALPAGRIVRGPVSLVDVMPTILELLGLPVPATVEGRSLLPLIRGEEGAGERVVVATVDERDSQLALLRGDWKLIVDTGSGRVELYHLASDPNELFDRAEEETEVLAGLREELGRWIGTR